MAVFVLVSGAWHAGWCWERVVPLLEAAGHHAVAPDLLGMGPDKTPLATVTLARWAEQIAAVIRAQDENVILVGHSRGGIVISSAAELVPEKIKTLVYLSAFMLPDGESAASAAAEVLGDPEKTPVVMLPDGTSMVKAGLMGPRFYNTSAPEWVARAESLATPEPMAVAATPLHLTPERYGRLRRIYIECLQDEGLPLPLQRQMQAVLPCERVFSLPTDHSPYYSAPEALVKCFEEIAAE